MASRTGVTVAVIGASGNVGRKIIELLVSRNVVIPEYLHLYASKKSAGKKITLAGHEWIIDDADEIDFEKIDLLLLATESEISKKFITRALQSNVTVVDSSSLYRLEKDVPLIVAPVNKHLVSAANASLYAIANCISSPIATVIAPLHRKYKVNRIVISTYQSVSGAGKSAMDELINEVSSKLNDKKYARKVFKRQIAFNLMPEIGEMMNDGFTHEEFKIMREIQKIVGAEFKITATAVRVPVMVGHSVSLGIEFEKKVSVEEIKQILSQAESVQVVDDYATPVEIEGSDDVYVGRIRKDSSVNNGVQMWICSDNLRRGAATDMVEVAAELVKQISERIT